MKKIYNCIRILTTILSIFFVQSQDLNWVPASNTGTLSASIGFVPNSILFNGETLTDGSAILGVFYIDDNNEYVCGGCLDLDENNMCDSLATDCDGCSDNYINGGSFLVPGWADDVTTSEKDGFENDETINFFINIDGVDYLADNIEFSQGNDNFLAGANVIISQIEFSSQQLEPCSCVDSNIVTEVTNGNCIIQAPNYCGSDPNSSNFCNISGFVNVIIDTPPTLYQNEAANGFPNEVCGLISGCTNPNATNYDSSATSDDGSCTILGCTCSNASNYDSTATNDDSSCVISVGCSDTNAVNFSGDDCPDVTYLEENCEYSDNCSDDDEAMGQLTCQQAITFFGCEETWNDNLISDACPESCDICAASCEDNNDAMGQLTCQQAITFFGCEETWNDNLISDACPESCNACDTSCEVENIQWEYDVTDGNMTIQIGAEVILLNGEYLPNGSLIGAFYTNDNNQLSCAGYLPYEGEQLALPIWGSESGLDNGFAIGESITWLVKVGNQTFSTNNFDMNSSPPFTDTYTPNGFGQILSAEFTCEVSGTLGCTDQNAYNFNSDATIDDGSCYNLDWTVVPTDCNMTILINDPEVVSLDISLNDSEIPPGVTIGVFYENQDGQLVCGGSVEWTGTSTALPAFGSESGLDNGFQVGEVFENWALLIGDQTIPMDANGATMNSFGFFPSYVCNGFGNLLSVNFEGDFVLTYGCTDETACNFDNSAVIDDGNCSYGQTYYSDSDGDGLGNPSISTVSCNEILDFVTNDDDPCPDNTENPNNSLFWYFDYDGDGLGDESFIPSVAGCNSPGPEWVDNNNDLCPVSSVNDSNGNGICDEEEVLGCTDSNAINFDPSANIDDESCVAVFDGCTDETAFNYNPDANNDDGSCIEVVEGCTDETAFNYNESANTDNGSCIEIVEGCTDETAFNYNPDANNDDGSCIEIVEGCTDETAFNYNELANTDDGSCIEVVEGCTDENAFNYNELANTDDGSCIEIVEGCTDETAFNYNELANIDDGSCIEVVEGCTDETAFNYNPLANTDDSSCIEVVEGCTDETAFNYNELANTDNGSCIEVIEGCTDETSFNYNPLANTDDSSCIEVVEGCTDEIAFNYNELANTDDGSCIEFIEGCTNETACNFDENANIDDNSCYYTDGICESCIEGIIIDNDLDDDGVCDADEVVGCQDESACNYDPNATDSCENTTCCTFVAEGELCAGCTDPSALNYNPESVDDDGSCIPFIYGCTDENACNFSADANTDDGTCISITTWYLDEDGDGLGFDSGGFFEIISCDEPSDDTFNYVDNGNDPSEGDYDNDLVFANDDCDDTDENVGAAEDGYNCNGECLLDEDEDGICNEFEIPGCTDIDACNYNLSATDNDDSCIYAEEFYDCDGICLSDIDLDGVCDELEVLGCTDDLACNFNTDATEDDSSCFYIDGICQTCENNQIVDNDEDGDGICDDDEITGCTDDSACNFDSSATDDDGSCFYTDGICQTCENGQIVDNDEDGDGICNDDEIPGCTDLNACNFDSLATDDDGSCFYTDGICQTCENGQIVDNDEDGDGICNDDEIPGCTDPNACNFDPELGCTDDDGSCFYSEITAEIIVIDTSCESLCDGEILLEINNGQPPFTVEYILSEQSIFSGGNLNNACIGNYLILITDALNCELTISATVDFDPSNPDSDGDGVCDSDELLGCTDEAACNFQIEATENDDSCYYCDGFGADIDGDGFDDCLLINADAISNGNDPIYGCDGCINDTDFDGVCDELEIVGCTDDGEQIWSVTPGYPSCTYDSSATEQCDDLDGNGIQDCCEYPTDYYLTCDGNCSDEDINNNFVIDPEEIGNGDIDSDGVCNVLEIEGCQDESACNFNILATDQGECEYADEFYNCDGCILDADLDGICDELEIAGCQDGLACNFDPLATDPAECFYLELTTIVDENIQNVSCPGESDGSFTISVFGGNGPYSLYISNLNGAEYNDESQDGLFVVANVSGGSYDVFISDINTCTTFESVDVEEIDPIDIQISYLNFISCDGGNDGALTNTISGGTPPYEFNWLDGNGLIISEEQDIYNLSAGAYAVQVVDNIGCSNQTTFILSEPNTLDISDVSVTDVSCIGGNDGNVEIDIIGGTPPFTYIFTDEFGSFVNPNSLTAGSYIVYANDSNGCSVNTDFSVNEPGSIDININALNSLICEDSFTTITADEGFESYQWYEVNTGFIFGNNTNTLNVNESGIYSVTATSFDGCEINSSTIEIIVELEPFFEINGINDVITGNTIIYYSNQNDNVSYEWSIIPSEMGEIISGNGTDEIEIIWGLEGDAQLFLTQTTTNGCENTESIDIDISWPFNLNDENEEIDFVIFPNPFSSYTNINVSNPRLLNYSIHLYDANGKIVKSYENINTESIRLNNNFSSGIYNLKLISSEGIKQKLILID